MTQPVSVRGGVGGIQARCDDLITTARLYGRASEECAGTALTLHGYLVAPDVLAGAPLDPVGAATVEGDLIGALDGPGGLLTVVARCAALDVALRCAADAYLASDRLAQMSAPLGAVLRTPRAVGDGAATWLRTGDPAAAFQRAVTADPGLTDVAVTSAGAALSARSVARAAAQLGALFPDGRPVVRGLGIDTGGAAGRAPRSLADVVEGLARRNLGRPGEVDVRIVTGAPSSPRQVIVDVPGTKDWSLRRENADITSVATNLRALAGVSTSYERGVLEAMRQAGVGPSDDVLLIGHSEGGMVAVNAALHAASGGRFRIGHVVTAGAPIGGLTPRVPPAVQVLALENAGDLVPHLDGLTNPDRTNVVTATVHHDHGRVDADHDLDESYRPGAADLDASGDPSTRAYLAGIRPFLTGGSVCTHTFQITRQP